MNKNSLIMYPLMILLVLSYFISGSLAFLGMIIGMLTIYFLLADDEEKYNIRNNLLFRTKKHDANRNVSEPKK